MENTINNKQDLKRSSSPTINDSLKRPHHAVSENKQFSPTCDLTHVSGLEKYEKFRKSLKLLFEQHLDKLSSPEAVVELLQAQGATLSVEHKIPVIENFFSQEEKPGKPGLYSVMKSFGKEATSFFDIEFWLAMFFWLGVARISYASTGKTDSSMYVNLTRLSYIVLTLLIISVTLHEVVYFGQENTLLEGFSDLFTGLKTEWSDLDAQNLDDLEMVMLPQGAGEQIKYATFGIIAILSFFSGLKIKNEATEIIIGCLKFNTHQTDNLSFVLKQASLKVSEFFGMLGQETLSKYFYVDIIDDRRVTKWLKEAKFFLAATSTGDVDNSAFYSEVYGELLNEGRKILNLVHKTSYDFRVTSEYMRKLNDCDDRIQTLKRSLNGTRVEPVGVLISGDPATFKTVLRDRLAYYVGSVTIPEPWLEDFENDPKEFEFALPKDRFFDKYNYKKWSVTIDDIFQARDTPGDPESEANKVISIINSSEMMLTMAKVEDKNGYYFRSPFVYATTNMKNFANLSSVESPGAVLRRFNVHLYVSVANKYKKNGKTNFKSMPKLDVDDLIDNGVTDSCTFVPDDFWDIKVTIRNGDNEEERFNQSIAQVVELIVTSHQSRIRNYYSNRFVEKNLRLSTATALRARFNTKNYSHLQFKTLNPIAQAQGGDDDSEYFDSHPNIFPQLTMLLDNFSFDERMSLGHEYLNQICKIRGSLLVHGEFDSYILVYESCTDKQKEKLMHYFLDKNYVGFMKHLVEIMEHRDNHACDPLTGTSLEIKNQGVSGLDKIKRFGKIIRDILDRYKLPILLFGLVSSSLIYWFFKASKDVSKSMVSQSLDLTRDRNKVGKPTIVKLGDRATTLTMRAQAPQLDSSLLMNNKLPDIDIEVLGKNVNQNDVLKRVINKYFFIVYVVKEVEGKPVYIRYGHSWNIKGQVFAVPLHFLYKWHNTYASKEYTGMKLMFTTSCKSTTYYCSLEDVFASFRVSEDSASNDCCLFTIPSSHLNSVGLFKYLISVEDYKVLQRSSAMSTGMFSSFHMQDKSLAVRFDYMQSISANHQVVTADWEEGKPYYELENVWRYAGSYSLGACGSMLFLNNVTQFNSRFILGMHVAGGDGYGASSIILKEWVELLLEESFPKSKIFDDEIIPSFLIDRPAEAQGSMEPTHDIAPTHTVSSASRSSIVKSRIFGQLPDPFRKVEHFPAKLHKFTTPEGVELDPGLIAIQKYNRLPVFIDVVKLRRAVNSYEVLITKHMYPHEDYRVTLSVKQCLHSYEAINTISSSTSPGFPMSLKNQENIKKLYYDACIAGNEELMNVYFEKIEKLVAERVSLYKDNIRPAIFYKDCLKDEKIPIEKVKIGKTRMFSACEFTMLVMFRMYFGTFMNSYFRANLNVGSAIGVNPYSSDWDDLARRLLRFSNKKTDDCVAAGDYSSFDTSLLPIILNHILGIINRWYGENNPDNQIRSQLWAEIVNSKHIWENQVFDWKMSMPSGNPLTPVINTMYNNIALRLCYGELFNVETFNDNVYVIALGDDNAFSCSPAVREDFNEVSVQRLMPLFGLKYTSELKAWSTFPFRQITQIEFLKRSFRLDKFHNRWTAPLRKESIFASLNWTQRGPMGDQITTDQISSALRELALHGKEDFDQFVTPLLDLKEKHLKYFDPAKPYSTDFDFVYGEVTGTQWYYGISLLPSPET